MSKVFGKLPSGERLKRVLSSPQYQNGKFCNQSFTPDLAEDATMWKVLKAFRSKPKTTKPPAPLPSVRPDLQSVSNNHPALIWFGHSSYYLQVEGLKILVDPVFSGKASPVPGMIKAFPGTDMIKVTDFTELDYVLITHDHYDHMDYESIRQLKSRTRMWITSLGVGAHLEYWGIGKETIIELDWWEEASLKNNCRITAAPSRHFSGRGMKRAQTIWSSFILNTPNYQYYLGGDSGWDTHFEAIGKRFGPFDLAILECGQYHPYWKHIHMMPEEVAKAAEALGAKKLLPVHWGKFSLALHPWDEPIERLISAAKNASFQLLTPMMGQTIKLSGNEPYNQFWWRDFEKKPVQ